MQCKKNELSPNFELQQELNELELDTGVKLMYEYSLFYHQYVQLKKLSALPFAMKIINFLCLTSTERSTE